LLASLREAATGQSKGRGDTSCEERTDECEGDEFVFRDGNAHG
jgi:hypothetical protein